MSKSMSVLGMILFWVGLGCLGFIMFCLKVVIDKRARDLKKWDVLVEEAKKKPNGCYKQPEILIGSGIWTQSGIATPLAIESPGVKGDGLVITEVPPPPDLLGPDSRRVLFQTEITDIFQLRFKPMLNGFEVFYRGKNIGACLVGPK